MAHVHITNDRDHKVFEFIRDRLAETAAFVNSADQENGEIQFAAKLDGVKLNAKLRQYWPPHDDPRGGNLVGTVDIYMTRVDGESEIVPASVWEEARRNFMGETKPSDSARPTTHEDLLVVYNTRASEHGCGFLLAGELDEAAHVLVNGEPALAQNRFKLRLPPGEFSYPFGFIELTIDAYELPRFGCEVSFYSLQPPPPREAIEAAFIELLDGAVP